ncbi:MAG: hypothetical protein HQK83_04035 [Fibrobacteria bacterium]|nr:hypothetical protein [Fibrobacteria bacterium]
MKKQQFSSQRLVKKWPLRILNLLPFSVQKYILSRSDHIEITNISRSLAKSTNIAVFLPFDSNSFIACLPLLDGIIRHYQKEKVTLIGFLTQKEIAHVFFPHLSVLSISRNDFHLKENAFETFMGKIRALKSDLAINLSDRPILLQLYLQLQTEANIRVNLIYETAPFCNVTLSSDGFPNDNEIKSDREIPMHRKTVFSLYATDFRFWQGLYQQHPYPHNFDLKPDEKYSQGLSVKLNVINPKSKSLVIIMLKTDEASKKETLAIIKQLINFFHNPEYRHYSLKYLPVLAWPDYAPFSINTELKNKAGNSFFFMENLTAGKIIGLTSISSLIMGRNTPFLHVANLMGKRVCSFFKEQETFWQDESFFPNQKSFCFKHLRQIPIKKALDWLDPEFQADKISDKN